MNARLQVRAIGASLVGALALAASAAHAAIDPAVDAMFTTMTADSTSALAKGWPLFGLITGGFVVYKIVKKVVGKAT